MKVTNGSVVVRPMSEEGVIEVTARGVHGICPLRLTVDQVMELGNGLIDAARVVRRATPIGAKGNE